MSYTFDLPKKNKSIIKVIGVGGGGSNAVNHMYNKGIEDVGFVVCNTDEQALGSSPVPKKLQIGAKLTEGLGVGGDPNMGKEAAIESEDNIVELLELEDKTKMVFITAGMGGGTGTGAAPVIARMAKERGILTVGIVTKPFESEGPNRIKAANRGIAELKKNCDTVLVILNDRLLDTYGKLTFTKAFAEADNILATAAKGIAEIITVPGNVNVDFKDVQTVMKDAGDAVMGSAIAKGKGRALKAAEKAINSPLLDNTDIRGAKKILVSIISGKEGELQMDEFNQITQYIQEKTGGTDIIFGQGIDGQQDSKSISVTVIATCFQNVGAGSDLESNRKIPSVHKNTCPPKQGAQTYIFDFPSPPRMNKEKEKKTPPQEADSVEQNEELKKKIAKLEEESLQREESLKGTQISQEEKDKGFKEKQETPAYQLKGIKFSEDSPDASDKKDE